MIHYILPIWQTESCTKLNIFFILYKYCFIKWHYKVNVSINFYVSIHPTIDWQSSLRCLLTVRKAKTFLIPILRCQTTAKLSTQSLL